jgi:hypothetical protein
MKFLNVVLISSVLLFISTSNVLAENLIPNVWQSIIIPELRGEYTPYTILIKKILIVGAILFLVFCIVWFVVFLTKTFEKDPGKGRKSKS